MLSYIHFFYSVHVTFLVLLLCLAVPKRPVLGFDSLLAMLPRWTCFRYLPTASVLLGNPGKLRIFHSGSRPRKHLTCDFFRCSNLVARHAQLPVVTSSGFPTWLLSTTSFPLGFTKFSFLGFYFMICPTLSSYTFSLIRFWYQAMKLDLPNSVSFLCSVLFMLSSRHLLRVGCKLIVLCSASDC